jgi:hypothetical protein
MAGIILILRSLLASAGNHSGKLGRSMGMRGEESSVPTLQILRIDRTISRDITYRLGTEEFSAIEPTSA